MTGTTGLGAVDQLGIWAGVIAAIAGLLALAARILRRVLHIAHRMEEFADDWLGVPGRPGVPARPGVMERLDRLDRDVAGIRHELHPNSGASLRDAIDRVEAATCTNRTDQ